MNQQITIDIINTQQQTVQGYRVISNFMYLDTTRTLLWQINTIYDNKIYKTEWYSNPSDELASSPLLINEVGMPIFDKFEKLLWQKTEEIDNMPESNLEERRQKSRKYGVAWTYHVNL